MSQPQLELKIRIFVQPGTLLTTVIICSLGTNLYCKHFARQTGAAAVAAHASHVSHSLTALQCLAHRHVMSVLQAIEHFDDVREGGPLGRLRPALADEAGHGCRRLLWDCQPRIAPSNCPHHLPHPCPLSATPVRCCHSTHAEMGGTLSGQIAGQNAQHCEAAVKPRSSPCD